MTRTGFMLPPCVETAILQYDLEKEAISVCVDVSLREIWSLFYFACDETITKRSWACEGGGLLRVVPRGSQQ